MKKTLKELRVDKWMTQAQAAVACDMSPNEWSYYERLDEDVIRKIAEVFDVDVDEIEIPAERNE